MQIAFLFIVITFAVWHGALHQYGVANSLRWIAALCLEWARRADERQQRQAAGLRERLEAVR